MPKAFPEEFRRDVVAVALRKQASMSQIARGFGISESCLHRWVKRAEIEDGVREGLTLAEEAEIPRAQEAEPSVRAGERGAAPRGDLPRARCEPKMIYPLVRDLATDGIVTWIERTYHRRHRQRALGKLTPIEFESVFEAAYAA
jgi:transposase-like protein